MKEKKKTNEKKLINKNNAKSYEQLAKIEEMTTKFLSCLFLKFARYKMITKKREHFNQKKNLIICELAAFRDW